MSRQFPKEKTVPLLTKLLLGLALLLLVPFAVAQNNLGELLDAGAKRLSAEEFRQEVVQRTIVGPTQSGGGMELIYASSGVIQGRGQLTQERLTTGTAGTILQSIDGVWNIDDSGRTCTSIVIGRTFLPFRCQYWYKYKDDYFIADSDSDHRARVVRRTVKQ
jgi:hypothetical protein